MLELTVAEHPLLELGVLEAVYPARLAELPSPAWLNIIYANIFISFFGVFALRGVYFSLLQESATPRHLTGTTVGIAAASKARTTGRGRVMG